VATTSEPFRKLAVFSDAVFAATDLNRRASEVFKTARKRPVTIARNNEQFALLPRAQAAELVQAAAQMGEAVRLFLGVAALKDGKPPAASVAWIAAFDAEDRAAMLEEVFEACKLACTDGDWEPAGDIIHQWHESALVASSGVLREVLQSPAGEQPVPSPAVSKPEAER